MLRQSRPYVKKRKIEPEKPIERSTPERQNKMNAFELAYAAHEGKVEVGKLTLAARKLYDQFSREELKAYQPIPHKQFGFNPFSSDKLSCRKTLKKAYNYKGCFNDG